MNSELWRCRAAWVVALSAGMSLAHGADDASLSVQSVPAERLAAPATSCHFGAFVAERDPAGLNVRAAPQASSRVLGRLPPTFVEPSSGYGVRVEVDVVGARDGWFLIRNARDNEMLTERAPRPLFKGEGWVSGNKLTVKSQADVGRAAPDPNAPALVRLGDDETFDSDEFIEGSRLADCRGHWALVELAERRLPRSLAQRLKVEPAARAGSPQGRLRAWVDRICGIQETSCTGLGAPEAAAP